MRLVNVFYFYCDLSAIEQQSCFQALCNFFSGNKVITMLSLKVPKHRHILSRKIINFCKVLELMGYRISGQKLTEGGVLIAPQPLMALLEHCTSQNVNFN